MTTDPEDHELNFAALLDLASMWRDDRVRRGEDPPDLVSIVHDPFFADLCNRAMRYGIDREEDHEHWCGMACDHNVDAIRGDGFKAAVREVETRLDGPDPVPTLRAWVTERLGEADGGD